MRTNTTFWTFALFTLCAVLSLNSHAQPILMGSVDHPISIQQLPFAHRFNTELSPFSDIDAYSCKTSADESGREMVYQFHAPHDGALYVTVEGDSDAVDVDVHLLAGLTLDAGLATECLARDHQWFSYDLSAGGPYYIVVDSFVSSGVEKAGPYILRVNLYREQGFDGEASEEIREGVLWERVIEDDFNCPEGAHQTINTLTVDWQQPSVTVRPIVTSECREPISEICKRHGAIACINGGFPERDECGYESFMKVDGVLLHPPTFLQGGLLVDEGWNLYLQNVDEAADLDWVPHGVGSINRIVEGGARHIYDNGREGMYAYFFEKRHPRTGLCLTSNNRLKLFTFDGRTEYGDGIPLDNGDEHVDFADFMVASGCADGVNLDGGGSTTMWTADFGVTNYPSDAGGERHLNNAVAIFGPPVVSSVYLKSKTLTEGETFGYQLSGFNANRDESFTYSLPQGPQSATVAPTGGEVLWTPTYSDRGENLFVFRVTDSAGGQGDQQLTITVLIVDQDADGMSDVWESKHGLNPTLDDSKADPDNDGISNRDEFEGGTHPLQYDGEPDAGEDLGTGDVGQPDTAVDAGADDAASQDVGQDAVSFDVGQDVITDVGVDTGAPDASELPLIDTAGAVDGGVSGEGRTDSGSCSLAATPRGTWLPLCLSLVAALLFLVLPRRRTVRRQVA